MNREDYLHQLARARTAIRRDFVDLREELNPLQVLRRRIATQWQWWLPGAALAGFSLSRLGRLLPGRRSPAVSGTVRAGTGSGSAFWISLALRTLLPMLTPLFNALATRYLAGVPDEHELRRHRH